MPQVANPFEAGLGEEQIYSKKKTEQILRYDLLRNWLILHPNDPLYLALMVQGSSGFFKECEAKCYERCKLIFGLEGKNKCYNLEKSSFPLAKITWGSFYHVALFDKPKDGNMIYLERVSGTPIIIEAGTTVIIAAEEVSEKKGLKIAEKRSGLLINFGNNGVNPIARSFQKQII